MESTASPSVAVTRAKPFLRWDTWLVAIVAYIPLLATKRGLLADDTKIYLYLDPGHLLATAASMWNSDVAFGTVTHQNIGYLLPMGPYYWATKSAGIPVWIAQRFWLGSLLFLAALGVRKCAQELGLSRFAGWAAALPYMLTPYILVNLDRTSAILMPWSGLGWMMLFTIRAARRHDWRHPALFALVVALVGGVNATSILMVGFAPLLYLLFAARIGEISWRQCRSVIYRIGSLSLAVSIWWLAGLWAEGKYGINILRFTESFGTVTYTSTSSEVFRGLGYWYFYGRDALQPWTLTSLSYVTGKFVPTASFAVPLVGFIAALCVRWRYRLLAVAITLTGVLVAVGSYPLAKPTPFGVVLKFFALHTTAALAMRSTNRVVPIVVLGLGLLSAAGFEALRQRNARWAVGGFAIFTAVVFLGMLPLFEGKAISSNLTFPSQLPSYINVAAHELDQGSSTSNVVGLPGQDFAYYRFGTANDSIWPGITHRPWISSQVQLAGEPASINLIRGLDSTLQNGVAVPSSIAPIARLFNAGNVLVQMNQQFERYDSPLPSYMWSLFSPMPKGLSLVGTYGPSANFQAADGPYIDEAILGLPIGYTFPRQLAILKVAHPRSLVRTEAASSPEIVAGNGEGLVTMASTGLLTNNRAIFFDAAESRSQVASLAHEPGAWLVLTDSNQNRLDTFGTLSATQGYVMQAGEKPLVASLSQATLPTFTNPPSGSETVAVMNGLAKVGASGYGNIITNNPEDQPFEAVDGKLNTAWEVSAFSPAIGQFFQMTALAPHLISRLFIVQPQSVSQNRYITKIGISINGGRSIIRTLDVTSTTAAGQIVTIPPTRGSTIRITILGDSDSDRNLPQASGVGFAEVDVAGFDPATRGLLLPTSLLSAVGNAAATDRLSIVTNRLRAATVPPRIDPELGILRYFDLPYARSFKVQGLANLNPAATDDQINALVGRHPGGGVSVADAESSSRLTGSLNDMAWDAFDNNPTTTWESRFRVGPGEWLRAHLTSSITLSTFSMTVINDGYHMIPTSMSVSNGTTSEAVTLPIKLATPNGQLNREQTFTVSIPPLSGSTFKFTFTGIKVVQVIDRVNGGPNYPGLGIVDIAMPGVSAGVTPRTFSTGCRSDLLSVDGHAVPIEISGSTQAALNQDELGFRTCGSSTLALSAGVDSLSSTDGYLTGLNVNNVVLTSPGPSSAAVTIDHRAASWYGRTVVRSSVGPADAGRWVVLAQSFGPGWHAELGGRDLGAPTMIDGASMGWLLPSTINGTEKIAFVWQPQQDILYALVFSALALLGVLVMAITDRPRRRVRVAGFAPDDSPAPLWAPFAGTLAISPKLLLIAALLIALAVSWYAIPVLLVVALLWTRWHRLGRFIGAVAVAFVAVGAAVTVRATQSTIQRDISWPTKVNFANTAVWIALALWTLAVLGTSTFGRASVEPGEPAVAVRVARVSRRRFRRTVTTSEVVVPSNEAARRRGLNVPVPTELDGPGVAHEMVSIPLGGLSRSVFLLRAAIRERQHPGEFQSIINADSVNQIVGRAPIFNRRVLEISDLPASRVGELIERGAHVTSMRREVPASRRGAASPEIAVSGGDRDTLVFTPTHVPADTESFDVVFATNVLSSVADPAALLAELVRVTRRGGTIYIQNVMWNSFLGGRETSPWHLISGKVARARYVKRNAKEPYHRYGVNYFKLTPHQLMTMISDRPDLAIFMTGPRFLPMKWGWTVHVPGLRALVLQDLVVVAERR